MVYVVMEDKQVAGSPVLIPIPNPAHYHYQVCILT